MTGRMIAIHMVGICLLWCSAIEAYGASGDVQDIVGSLSRVGDCVTVSHAVLRGILEDASSAGDVDKVSLRHLRNTHVFACVVGPEPHRPETPGPIVEGGFLSPRGRLVQRFRFVWEGPDSRCIVLHLRRTIHLCFPPAGPPVG
jgi:hypothetical protein